MNSLSDSFIIFDTLGCVYRLPTCNVAYIDHFCFYEISVARNFRFFPYYEGGLNKVYSIEIFMEWRSARKFRRGIFVRSHNMKAFVKNRNFQKGEVHSLIPYVLEFERSFKKRNSKFEF